MTDGTTSYNEGEILSGVQRRRRWTPEEKVRIVEETYLPGMSVSLVARRHGIGGNQIFTWRRLMTQGALTAAGAGAGEEVVPASEYRAVERRCASCNGCWARRPRRTSCSARPCPGLQAQKNVAALDLVAGGWSVTAVADALDITRQNLSAMRNRPPPRPRGRPPLPDAELVADIRALVADLPTSAVVASMLCCAVRPRRPGA